MVCGPQPLAASAGLTVLNEGGSAVDAAIAVAAALNVTEVCLFTPSALTAALQLRNRRRRLCTIL